MSPPAEAGVDGIQQFDPAGAGFVIDAPEMQIFSFKQ